MKVSHRKVKSSRRLQPVAPGPSVALQPWPKCVAVFPDVDLRGSYVHPVFSVDNTSVSTIYINRKSSVPVV